MIGYYVHHVGSGHLHRAQAIARASNIPVVGLSSLARPAGWDGGWVRLPRDDEGPFPSDVTAGGRLHWVPLGDEGLLSRTAALSAWISQQRPRLLVADVSSEVAVLARLHGVPVVSVVLPGRRDDYAHLLGFGVSSALIAAWPPDATGMLPDLLSSVADRVRAVGAISRFGVPRPTRRRPGCPRVTVLLGRGGGAPSPEVLDDAQRQSPSWAWTVLGGEQGWQADPLPALLGADVVICQAGQNAIAEVAALRRPAVVIPADRPHHEQRVTARVLAGGGWPVRVEDSFPRSGWAERLDAVRNLDGTAWAGWCDGQGAYRAARAAAVCHDRAPAEAVA